MPTSPSLVPRVGLTLGDPAGIGPEVMLAALAETGIVNQARIRLFTTTGQVPWLRGLLAAHQLPGAGGGDRAGLELVALAPAGRPDAPPSPGQPSPSGRWQAFAAIDALVGQAVAGRLDVMVTGPVTKGIFDHLKPRPPGQTEFLAGTMGVERFAMLLAGPRLRVVPVTTHVPLRRVAELLTAERIYNAASAVAGDLQRWFGIATPRLAVCGLNPHAGEGGRVGDEEATIIAPAVARLRQDGVAAVGPLPADALFHQALSGRWDAVICMFHDQALGPLKTAHFGDALNMTCGLPTPRLSPDHGTAFDLAGTGRADPGSCVAALQRALHIGQLRCRSAVARGAA